MRLFLDLQFFDWYQQILKNINLNLIFIERFTFNDYDLDVSLDQKVLSISFESQQNVILQKNLACEQAFFTNQQAFQKTFRFLERKNSILQMVTLIEYDKISYQKKQMINSGSSLLNILKDLNEINENEEINQTKDNKKISSISSVNNMKEYKKIFQTNQTQDQEYERIFQQSNIQIDQIQIDRQSSLDQIQVFNLVEKIEKDGIEKIEQKQDDLSYNENNPNNPNFKIEAPHQKDYNIMINSVQSNEQILKDIDYPMNHHTSMIHSRNSQILSKKSQIYHKDLNIQEKSKYQISKSPQSGQLFNAITSHVHISQQKPKSILRSQTYSSKRRSFENSLSNKKKNSFPQNRQSLTSTEQQTKKVKKKVKFNSDVEVLRFLQS